MMSSWQALPPAGANVNANIRIGTPPQRSALCHAISARTPWEDAGRSYRRFVLARTQMLPWRAVLIGIINRAG
jgi:hypothetical protein